MTLFGEIDADSDGAGPALHGALIRNQADMMSCCEQPGESWHTTDLTCRATLGRQLLSKAAFFDERWR